MQVFNNNMDRDTIVLLAARASRIENQDAIDEAIVNMLADPKEVGIYIRHLTYTEVSWFYSFVGVYVLICIKLKVPLCLCMLVLIRIPLKESFHLQARANITEVHFLPFNPVDKRTAITYIDSDGNWHRASKGAPEQVSICL